MNVDIVRPLLTESRKNWFGLITLILAQTIIVLDNVTLMLSADSLVTELSFTLSQLQVTNTIYPMIGATFMIAGGMLGLIIGWQCQIQIGMSILVLSSLWATFATTTYEFTYGARILAGIGGSLLIPAVFGYCTAFYKGKQQAIAFGMISGSIGLTGMLSPIMLGGILDTYSFRAVYALIALFSLIAIGSSFILKKGTRDRNLKFDAKGMVIASLALLSTIIALLNIERLGFIEAKGDINIFGYSPVPFLFLLGFIAFKWFFHWESTLDKRGERTLFPASLRSNKRVWFGMFFCAMTYALYPTMAFITVTYLQFSNEFSALQSGTIVGLNAFGMVTGSILTPILLYGRSTKLIMTCANMLCIIGVMMMLMAYEVGGVSYFIYYANVIFGLGCGIFAAHSPLIITTSVAQSDAEQSSGIQATSRNFGKAMGLAVMGTILTFAHSSSFKMNTLEDASLSVGTQQMIVEEQSIPFTHQQTVLNVLEERQIDEDEQKVIASIAIFGRLDAMRSTLGAFVFLILLSQGMALMVPGKSPQAVEHTE
ncbi:MFS transporter [Vibrio splendidus]|uniref:MFS transporter n=1 Tax=Vibrio splendidus TaxID=29497 RepID=UPI0021B34A18|nr:MFS transporter [Vibrio splendidus]UXA00631.1 MFS transporter [Vibrio splendidus]